MDDFLNKIFYGEPNGKIKDFTENKFCLAHYTHSKTALSMLDNGEIWLGNVKYMNDYSEIVNGMNLVYEVLRSSSEGDLFKTAIDSLYPYLFNEVLRDLNSIQARYLKTYAFCLTEHREEENSFGRLSMWRAYAPKNGVALIFNGKILNDKIDYMDLLPMYYMSKEELQKEIRNLADILIRNIAVLRHEDRNKFKLKLLEKFSYVFWSLKHKAFWEEKEWRVICNTDMFEKNIALKERIETCFDEPRIIQRFQFKEAGIDLNECLTKIVIGPSQNEEALKEIFIHKLKEKGIDNTKVECSHIPLRI